MVFRGEDGYGVCATIDDGEPGPATCSPLWTSLAVTAERIADMNRS